MSMDTCSHCSKLVDTDFDLDFYVDIGNQRRLEQWIGLCESCRDRREEQLARESSMEPPNA